MTTLKDDAALAQHLIERIRAAEGSESMENNNLTETYESFDLFPDSDDDPLSWPNLLVVASPFIVLFLIGLWLGWWI